MPCEDFMIEDPPRLHCDTPVREAMSELFCNRVFALPVVDGLGRFAGLFDVHQMLRLILPKAVTMDRGLIDLSWAHDTGSTLGKLQRRLEKIGDDPISDYLTTDTPTIPPATPVMESLRSLYHRPGIVPVVEPESGRLVGIVTCWDLMAHVAEPVCKT